MSENTPSDLRRRLDPPESAPRQVLYSVGRAAVASVPVIGGPAQVLFESIFRDPLERRRENWMVTVADAIEELKDSIPEISEEALAANDGFVNAVMQASQIAQRTHDEEKLNALRNAIQSVAISNPPDEDMHHIFLRLVDEFTPLHLRLLVFFDNPGAWFEKNSRVRPEWPEVDLMLLAEFCHPQLVGDHKLFLIVHDLQQRQLVVGNHPYETVGGNSCIYQSQSGPLGKEFLRFIEKRNWEEFAKAEKDRRDREKEAIAKRESRQARMPDPDADVDLDEGTEREIAAEEYAIDMKPIYFDPAQLALDENLHSTAHPRPRPVQAHAGDGEETFM